MTVRFRADMTGTRPKPKHPYLTLWSCDGFIMKYTCIYVNTNDYKMVAQNGQK